MHGLELDIHGPRKVTLRSAPGRSAPLPDEEPHEIPYVDCVSRTRTQATPRDTQTDERFIDVGTLTGQRSAFSVISRSY
jgi:hypothetical protein